MQYIIQLIKYKLKNVIEISSCECNLHMNNPRYSYEFIFI